MAKDHRVTRTRRHAYRNTLNRTKTIKTPGGKYAVQYLSKIRKGAICGDCHTPLPGIPHLDARHMKNAKHHDKTVSRAYGGAKCHACVRQRIVRAFLIEEQKIVKKVLAEKGKKKTA